MQSLTYIPGGFRMVGFDGSTTMWTVADLPSEVKGGTAPEIEDWMTANLPAVVGLFVAVKVESTNPFRFQMAVSQSPIDKSIFNPSTPEGDSGGGG